MHSRRPKFQGPGAQTSTKSAQKAPKRPQVGPKGCQMTPKLRGKVHRKTHTVFRCTFCSPKHAKRVEQIFKWRPKGPKWEPKAHQMAGFGSFVFPRLDLFSTGGIQTPEVSLLAPIWHPNGTLLPPGLNAPLRLISHEDCNSDQA